MSIFSKHILYIFYTGNTKAFYTEVKPVHIYTEHVLTVLYEDTHEHTPAHAGANKHASTFDLLTLPHAVSTVFVFCL